MENIASTSHIVPISSGCSTVESADHLRYTLGGIAKTIFEIRQKDIESSLNNTKVRYFGSCFIDGDLGQIFGDIGNIIFSSLSIAQVCHPILASSSAFSWASCILGSFGGVLNIGVGLYCLNSAKIKHENLTSEGKAYIEHHGPAFSFILSMKGDAPEEVQKYYRMVWDGVFMIGIGAVMTVISLSIKITKLGAIGTFFAANPWVLPLLWFVITVPILLEVARSNKNIWNGTDLAGLMELSKLQEAIQKKTDFIGAASETNPLKKIVNPDAPEEHAKHENSILEDLKARIGTEAATEAMHLRSLLLQGTSREEIKSQFDKLENAIAAWNKTQKSIQEETDFFEVLIANIGPEAAAEASCLRCLLVEQSPDREITSQISILKKAITAWDWDTICIRHENKILKDLETSIGAEAAIEAMRLRALLLERASTEEIEPQIKTLENAIAAWNRAQRCKLVQQSLLIASFACSIIGLSPQIPQKVIGVVTNGVILLGNLIPLGMDIAWPFRRNCPIDVEIANEDTILKKMQTIEELPQEDIA